ncbi:UDP-4-amino-4,6-dideoxy-N-acetyl-beta-L-altrosamine transaminase [Adhaeribacter pallidiroseus]|uniref:UDP-4-amino-4-deoxy-L-arabinose--oxoglutarate aminotransferase n=1 Tax=Adhaeribacter pallidiroseus TaxID=2072847 RepID=A0A369QAR5_9BACT|nr:UDP-4-amino-4,6-dideoxy-N-acetyl-beta-L-altrosamine transaminase [Adhaeribacter pallidiroseus]RDC62013.1 UDP-4-amino-4-deoxy-L-arabinose--oxoglutarate aminotransferase [Adhaeribacter pallidiroseus]
MGPIPYGKQNITAEDIQAVVETLQSDFLTQGPKVEEFETKFAQYIGCDYALAVTNGTAALHLCAMVLGVNEQSNVITSPITFAASANCLRYCGGTVWFADIDPTTGLLDIAHVRILLESKPKDFFTGIIPVDFAGLAVNLEAFRQLADEYNLWLLEDACHAPGGSFTDSSGTQQNCGNSQFADLAIFSFHPVKHIATGEGGMITTNNRDFYEKLLRLRTHGITKNPELLQHNPGGWYYEMQDLGYNYRIPDILTALGISQLNRADANLKIRRQIAARYNEAFQSVKSISILNPTAYYPELKESGHAYHLYIIQVPDRKGLYDYLRQHQIFAQVHYIPVHTMPYYQQLGWKYGDFPRAEKFYEHCLSLPMFPTLTNQEQQYVIDKVLEFVNF